MPGEMKFEESSLTGYLVKHLQPLTAADPAILAEYVVALLKNDKPTKELQKLCADNLEEFLGQSTKSFTAELFQALEDGSIVRSDGNFDVNKSEPSQPSVMVGNFQLKNSSPKEENPSTSSEHVSDSEDKEVSDDDDDDRNHKHRRREARPDSFDNDVQEQFIRRPNRKRNKPYDNGQLFLETGSQSTETQKEYNPTSERNISSKFDRRRSGMAPLMRAPLDLVPRSRLSQALRTDPGARFDLSVSTGRPLVGRGRGRSTGSWSQHESRFNPLDTLDFASQMASQGPTHPSMFVGTGLPSAASTQNPTWGGFGFIPGMPNRILDPLHPLGLQGTLRPAMTPSLNLGMPRQRCRDFEERGFCLRGDMCPMEHGLNRIVVEDVQSLSQFNLPVSIPSSHALGIQAGSGTLPPVAASSSILANSKAASNKNNRSGGMDDEAKLNGVTSTSGGADADVYDPDQPLWNNDHPEASNALLKLPSPNTEDEPLWDADSSARQSCRLSDVSEGELPGRNVTDNFGVQTANLSVWGRIGSGSKSEAGRRTNSKMTATSFRGNELKEDHEDAIANSRSSSQGKRSNLEIGPKVSGTFQSVLRSHADHWRNSGRPSQRATRTLYVNGVPQINNTSEALLSHFQKFGEVIDIYIPQNSEKAFVQFSKREEAEAALKAPDAVMGNRFIKLFWANRDRISDEGQSSSNSRSIQSPTVVVSSVPSPSLVADAAKENLFLAQKRNSALTAETSMPVAGTPKALITNGAKAVPHVQKKQENLEVLKEELRKKQEILAQKRNDFRRQLDKFEKQAISVKKGDLIPEQAVKRHKADAGGKEAVRAASLSYANLSNSGARQEADKTLEKRNSGEVLVSPRSKANSTVLQHSPRNMKPATCTPAPTVNRFKLDNRTTTFRILPPLPDDLANAAVLKDHFLPFGAISSIVLEDPEAHTDNAGSKPSRNCSACITFTTRNSAERAYQGGKCWEGHSLQFMWLTVSSHSTSDFGLQETSLTPKEAPKGDTQADGVTSGSSSSGAGKSTTSVISEVGAVRNEEPNMDVEGTNFISISQPKSPLQSLQISPTMSACETCSPESDIPMVEDGVNVCFAE